MFVPQPLKRLCCLCANSIAQLYPATLYIYIYICVCVCVNPWAKGSPPPAFPPQLYTQGGNARLTDIAQRRRCQFVVKQCGTPHCVPAEFFTSCDPPSPRFVSWFFHVSYPKNRFPTAAFSRRRSAALLQTSEQFVQQFSCADPVTLRFPHSF